MYEHKNRILRCEQKNYLMELGNSDTYLKQMDTWNLEYKKKHINKRKIILGYSICTKRLDSLVLKAVICRYQ